MLAIVVPAVLLAAATQTHVEGDNHMIPHHGGGGYHEFQVNKAYGDAPCEVQVAVRGKSGDVLYYTCK